MTIQYSDVSGYAVVVIPEINNPTPVSLYHWRHVVGDWEPTEIELLHKQSIKPCPTMDYPDNTKRSEWVSAYLAPALEAVSIRVPRGTTVAICIPETVAVLTDYPRDVIDEFCKNYVDKGGRKVKFERAVLTGPLDQVFTAPARPHEYMAVYTVQPENVLRIYDRSQSVPRLIHTRPIEEVIDVTTEEQLEKRVISWVNTFLRPALNFTVDSTPLLVQLYLPTKDLCANPNNDYNSVRDQIMRQLRANPPVDVTVTLAGSTDSELPLTILDRVFQDHRSHLLSSDKYVMTLEHTADEATVFVDHWSGTTTSIIFEKTISIAENEDDSDAIKEVFTGALGTIRDSTDDMTPFVALFVAMDGTPRQNEWFYKPARTYWGTKRAEWLASVQLAGTVGGHAERVKTVIVPVFRHVIVVDAGSGGTRAFAYRWRTAAEVAPVRYEEDGPFQHPRLPYVRLVGECKVGNGIHERQAGNVAAYLLPLFNQLNDLVALRNITKATTPLFGLATGGMRTRRQDENANLGPYNALVAQIGTSFGGQGFHASTSFGVATGDDEAMYGWITANYSLGRLDQPAEGQPTKGFLEIGGASMQVAYQAPDNHNGQYMGFKITHGVLDREFRVFTREIDNLGARAARTRYIEGQRIALGAGFVIDRCWPSNLTFPRPQPEPLLPLLPVVNVTGTGLCLAGANLAQFLLPVDKLARLTESLVPVSALLPGQFLPVGHPVINVGTQFVGGATFWHVSQALYPPGNVAAHSYNRNTIKDLILAFATIPWATHLGRVEQAATNKVTGMSDAQVNVKRPGQEPIQAKRAALREDEIRDNIPHKSATLFGAMVIYATLYNGLELPNDAMFQPFNGVIGLDAFVEARKVPYSWTLGRAVVSVIESAVPELVAAA